MATKLDCFKGMVESINKKYNYKLRVDSKGAQVELFSEKGRVYGTSNPINFESALKSLKKDGTISHYLFEERKEYRSFIDSKLREGMNPKQAHKEYFQSLL